MSRCKAPIYGLILLVASTAFAGTVRVPGLGGDIAVAVTSFKERQYQTIRRQEHDFSCGSAALASLLSFHYDDVVTEKEVFSAMLASADLEKVRREGFSMLDMKKYLERAGYQADGFRLPLEGIRTQARIPVIALMDIDGFRHFVLVKGISDEEVLVGDPARGLKVYTHTQFNEAWDGVGFVIRSHIDLGRAHFNQPVEWRAVARAPVGLNQRGDNLALGDVLLHLPIGLDW
jgi:hypothetical protein